MWWICNSRKRKAIGGWLLFYYIQLFGGVIFSVLFLLALLTIGTWRENIISFVYNVVLIIEVIWASMLLSKKFRNLEYYNFLRITLLAQFMLGLVAFLGYGSGNILMIIGSVFWFLYFTWSKRVELVFIENKWNPDTFNSKMANESVKKSRGFAGFVKRLFKGRLGRLDFLYLALLYFVSNGILFYIIGTLNFFPKGRLLGFSIFVIVIAGVLYFSMWFLCFSFLVRRLHDFGRSGFWVLMIFFPFLNLLFFLYLLFARGDTGTNLYGSENNQGSFFRRIFNLR
jgi:uncharacterized membrane protein YhaH (DUF805 family)